MKDCNPETKKTIRFLGCSEFRDYNSDTIKELFSEVLGKEKTFSKRPIASVIHTACGDYVTGWNGPLSRGLNYPLKKDIYYPSEHAEKRAIYRAAMDGVMIKDGTIFLSEWFPCEGCAKAIIESGLARVVTPDKIYINKKKSILVPKLREQIYNFELAETLLRRAGIHVVVDKAIKV
jgi:deoxycytidylate deaminase